MAKMQNHHHKNSAISANSSIQSSKTPQTPDSSTNRYHTMKHPSLITASGPSTLGRALSGIIGLGIGTAITYYFMKDYQLIKFEPVSNTEQKPKKFKVSFREMQEIELKPEVVAARAAKAKQLDHDIKEEIEQVIQDPTT